MNPALVRSISGLDDLARVIFPDNKTHRQVFVAIWVELKYAEDRFLPSFSQLTARYDFSERVLEIARAKLKKMGVLKRVSHFSPHHGHVGGWTFSSRFSQCLRKLAKTVETVQTPTGRSTDEEKDRDSSIYV